MLQRLFIFESELLRLLILLVSRCLELTIEILKLACLLLALLD